MAIPKMIVFSKKHLYLWNPGCRIFYLLSLTVILILTSCDSDYKKLKYNPKSVEDSNLNRGKWGQVPVQCILKNESYADYDNKNANQLTFDLYKPQQTKNKLLPLLLFVHSGAFISGDKRNYIITKYCLDFCSTGRFASASLNYRLIDPLKMESIGSLISKGYTRKKIFEAVGDVKHAVNFFRDHANDYNIDPERIFLIGYSSGGIIGHHAVFTTAEEANEYVLSNNTDKTAKEILDELDPNNDLFKIDNISELDNDMKRMVKGIVAIGGGMLDFKHIDASDLSDLPFLAIHGNKDKIMPFGLGYPFAQFSEIASLPLAAFYYEIGVKKTQDNRPSEDQIEIDSRTLNVETGVQVPKPIMKLVLKLLTSEVCGSACVEARLPSSKNYKMIELMDAPHVFMLNNNGLFNKTYELTREQIFSFLVSQK